MRCDLKSISEQLRDMGLTDDMERFVKVTLTFVWYGEHLQTAIIGSFSGIEEAKTWASQFGHRVKKSISISITNKIDDVDALRFQANETQLEVLRQMESIAHEKWGPAEY